MGQDHEWTPAPDEDGLTPDGALEIRGAAAHLSLRLADGVVSLSRYAKREAVDWR